MAEDVKLVTLAEIQAARAALPPQVVRTPLLRAEELDPAADTPVWLKAENLQITGSYKARATFTLLNNLPAQYRERGAALSSSGNFAGAFAYMGRLLGIPTAVVMQEKTSPLKIARTRAYGGEVILCPNDFDARWATLFALEPERGIHAFNTFEHPDVLRGHGTIGLEMVEALPEVDTILIPVSSGGLIAGVATAVKELRPQVRVIGVQPAGSNATYLSVKNGEVTRIGEIDTICDALIAAHPGHLPFAHIQKYVDELVVVPDNEVKSAMRWLVEKAKLVAEAGGAIATAALLSGRAKATGKTIVLVSGGNVLPETLAQYLLETSA